MVEASLLGWDLLGHIWAGCRRLLRWRVGLGAIAWVTLDGAQLIRSRRLRWRAWGGTPAYQVKPAWVIFGLGRMRLPVVREFD